MSNNPNSLKEYLIACGVQPTGNIDWDKGVADTLKKRKEDEAIALVSLSSVINRSMEDMKKTEQRSHNLEDEAIYNAHAKLLMWIANNIVLKPQRRSFTVDENNQKILRFLLYYFNDCPLAEEVFPERKYKLHKNLLLQGTAGVGKTMLMQIFSEYLRRCNNPRFFYNLSVTQMVNYYTIHNNLDRFTYNEEESKGFQCKPENVCLNDIGIQDKTFFGMDTGLLTDEFMHARNEIWVQFGKYAHITTNLDDKQLVQRFSRNDKHNRLVDRLKTYNVIPVSGTSRR